MQERRAREEKEHQARERKIAAAEETEAKIPPSNGKSYIQQTTSPVKAISPTSPQRSITQAEEMRQQRNKEAKELIGGRVGTAKAIFSQNTAAGQLSGSNNGGFKAAPVKPVRNSITQRINTLNSHRPDEPTPSNYSRVAMPTAIAEDQPVAIPTPSSDLAEPEPEPQQQHEVANVKTNNVDDLANDAGPQKQLEEDDGDQFSTIKRSPYSKNSNSQAATPVDAQPPIVHGHEVNNGGVNNGNGVAHTKSDEQRIGIMNKILVVLFLTHINCFVYLRAEDVAAEDMIYQNVMSDEGLRARALYDYQAGNFTIHWSNGSVRT